jgi:MoxR-like ATPase
MPIYYKGSETQRPSTAIELEQILRTPRPQRYTADADLAAAVNVALILGKPLLLTGDPGTGKTELAGHVAMALGLGDPERFDTRSTSQANELFYRFDSLARFHWANSGSPSGRSRSALDFITLGPLGRAILRSLAPTHPLFEVLGLPHPSPQGEREPQRAAARSVVLIDEIDKAPRDFPNDLLDAIDNLRFSIRELEKDTTEQLLDRCGTSDITAAPRFKPVVVITSNSEKSLPPPFLRRCVYFHIRFPQADRLRAIVARRINDPGCPARSSEELSTLGANRLSAVTSISPQEAKPLLHTAVEFFCKIRELDLRKPPSTAELIDWLQYLLKSGARASEELAQLALTVHQSLGVLVKSVEDLEIAREFARARVPVISR